MMAVLPMGRLPSLGCMGSSIGLQRPWPVDVARSATRERVGGHTQHITCLNHRHSHTYKSIWQVWLPNDQQCYYISQTARYQVTILVSLQKLANCALVRVCQQ